MIKNYCIYLITNLVNNKKYVGKTSADTTRRWKDHIRDSQKPNGKNGRTKNLAIHRLYNMNRKMVKHILVRNIYKYIDIPEELANKVRCKLDKLSKGKG